MTLPTAINYRGEAAVRRITRTRRQFPRLTLVRGASRFMTARRVPVRVAVHLRETIAPRRYMYIYIRTTVYR